MGKKKINLGNVGGAGDTIGVTVKLDDATLGMGERTNFYVTFQRIEGQAITNLVIWMILLAPNTVELYPPFATTGNGRIDKLESGESQRVQFLIDNGLEGDNPAAYNLLCVIKWDEHSPFVLQQLTIP